MSFETNVVKSFKGVKKDMTEMRAQINGLKKEQEELNKKLLQELRKITARKTPVKTVRKTVKKK